MVGVAPKTSQSGQKTKIAKISGGIWLMKQLYDRLIASGKRAKHGDRFLERIKSVYASAKLQNINPLLNFA